MPRRRRRRARPQRSWCVPSRFPCDPASVFTARAR
jgi:hypothetical protein